MSIDASDAFAYGIGTDGPIGLTITSCCSQRGTTIDNPIPTAVLSLCVVFGVGHDVFGNSNRSVVSLCGVLFSEKKTVPTNLANRRFILVEGRLEVIVASHHCYPPMDNFECLVWFLHLMVFFFDERFSHL